VYGVGIGHHRQRGSHSDAVVGSERRALGAYPVAVDHSGDGGMLEVKRLVVALAHHIHMSLQDHRRGILMPGCSRRFDHHIAHLVGLCLKIVALGEIEQILAYFLLFLRGTGHLRNLVEDFKNPFGFEFFYCHVADSLL